MKVYDIKIDTMALAVTPLGDRLYRLAQDTALKVCTDEGVFVFSLQK